MTLVVGAEEADLLAGSLASLMSATEPATGRWSAAEDMPWALSFHRAVPLPSGKVLVMGGTDTGCVDVGYREAFIYDPTARTWGITGGLSVGRWDFAAAGLPDGRVLTAGGITLGALATADGTEQQLTKTAEILHPDPAYTGLISRAPTPARSRADTRFGGGSIAGS